MFNFNLPVINGPPNQRMNLKSMRQRDDTFLKDVSRVEKIIKHKDYSQDKGGEGSPI